MNIVRSVKSNTTTFDFGFLLTHPDANNQGVITFNDSMELIAEKIQNTSGYPGKFGQNGMSSDGNLMTFGNGDFLGDTWTGPIYWKNDNTWAVSPDRIGGAENEYGELVSITGEDGNYLIVASKSSGGFRTMKVNSEGKIISSFLTDNPNSGIVSFRIREAGGVFQLIICEFFLNQTFEVNIFQLAENTWTKLSHFFTIGRKIIDCDISVETERVVTISASTLFYKKDLDSELKTIFIDISRVRGLSLSDNGNRLVIITETHIIYYRWTGELFEFVATLNLFFTNDNASVTISGNGEYALFTDISFGSRGKETFCILVKLEEDSMTKVGKSQTFPGLGTPNNRMVSLDRNATTCSFTSTNNEESYVINISRVSNDKAWTNDKNITYSYTANPINRSRRLSFFLQNNIQYFIIFSQNLLSASVRLTAPYKTDESRLTNSPDSIFGDLVSIPRISAQQQSTLECFDVSEVQFDVFDILDYHTANFKFSPCKERIIPKSKEIKTHFDVLEPHMRETLACKGKGILEKVRNWHAKGETRPQCSLLIDYGMAKFVLARLLYNEFSICWLLRKNSKKFFSDLKDSRFCQGLSFFKEDKFKGYEKFFKWDFDQ